MPSPVQIMLFSIALNKQSPPISYVWAKYRSKVHRYCLRFYSINLEVPCSDRSSCSRDGILVLEIVQVSLNSVEERFGFLGVDYLKVSEFFSFQFWIWSVQSGEMNTSDLGWYDEEKSVVNAVLGNSASDFLRANSNSNQNLFLVMETDDSLNEKLSRLVDWLKSENFSWNYAIFWQQTISRSGHQVLGWGDGCCREPNEQEESKLVSVYNSNVLQKLHRLFGESDEDKYVLSLEKVTATEIFFLASMYFFFNHGEGGPGRCYASGKHVWLFDAVNSVSDYCFRSFMAKSEGIRTIVMVLTDAGVLELGYVWSLPENIELVKSVHDFFMRRDMH